MRVVTCPHCGGDWTEPTSVDKPDRRRVITSDLLRQVADVYAANIQHAPTEAVARFFAVKPRMASTYVQRARDAGILPSTTQGKKLA